jgi:hypothetical protein
VRRVRTETSLHVLAYNLKRAMKILGTRPLIQAIRAYSYLLNAPIFRS